MALIKCPECGREVSDKAKACVHCGCPIEEDEEIFTCDNCGANVKESDTECPKCGCKFIEDESEEITYVREQLRKNNNDIRKTTEDIVKKYGMFFLDAKIFVEQVLNNDDEIVVPRYIVRTIIVGNSSKKKMGSALGRAAIGGALLGPVGLIAGTTAKTKDTTTFQVIYSDGTQETTTVKNNNPQFKTLCSYLDK